MKFGKNVDLLKKAAESGDEHAKYLYSLALESGFLIKQNTSQAATYERDTSNHMAAWANNEGILTKDKKHKLYLILLVDDSNSLRRHVKQAIQNDISCLVLEASSSKQAQTLLTRYPNLDLLITDIHMPVDDGFDLINYVIQNPKLVDLPTIVLSSDANKTTLLRGKSAGVKRWILKSSSTSQITSMIRSLLEIPTAPT